MHTPRNTAPRLRGAERGGRRRSGRRGRRRRHAGRPHAQQQAYATIQRHNSTTDGRGAGPLLLVAVPAFCEARWEQVR